MLSVFPLLMLVCVCMYRGPSISSRAEDHVQLSMERNPLRVSELDVEYNYGSQETHHAAPLTIPQSHDLSPALDDADLRRHLLAGVESPPPHVLQTWAHVQIYNVDLYHLA